MSISTLSSVERFTILFNELLQLGKELKPAGTIDPLLRYEDLKQGIDAVGTLSKELGTVSNAAIEATVRNIFINLISTIPIRDPGFGHVWNLFDIANTVSDFEFTDPGLALRLIEELLEAQTLDGCRIVLDYLDSRQEFLTEKFFKNRKDLIILRACNDLLRRSSRAEDNAFCGRVFIFLFQCIPYGDNSAVNLRGQFHTENVTVFEDLSNKHEDPQDDMVLDTVNESDDVKTEGATQALSDKTSSQDEKSQSNGPEKAVKFESTIEQSSPQLPDMDALYSIFWSLQTYFSQPMTLLNTDNIQKLKTKLETVMGKFKEIQQNQLASGANKVPVEMSRGTKRKHEDSASEFTRIFNPKYLTSRDLFDLEVSDLSFRRHFLVQALILIDFILSLTPQNKKKLYPPEIPPKQNNTSTDYQYLLSDEDSKWASQMKDEIAIYLKVGPEGPFYYRMVDTVLSRDKNWAYWKARGCPKIELDPVSPEKLVDAEKAAQKACAPRRIRPAVLGALDLSFLDAKQSLDGLEKYKEPERYQLPVVEALKGGIADDVFDIESTKDDEEKRAAQERRASKLWRTLRLASRGRLRVFDQIDDGNNLGPLFEPHTKEASGKTDTNGTNGTTDNSAQDESQTLGTASAEGRLSPAPIAVEVTSG